MQHPLQCQCGKVTGHVMPIRRGARGICYCEDCRAFAHFLGRANEILDEHGGTEIIPTAVTDIHFSSGNDSLRCMRLSPTGLLRWYTECCRTPVGNTSANPRVPYIGLVHNFLAGDESVLTQTFDPIRIRAYPKRAKGTVEKQSWAAIPAVARIGTFVLLESLKGSYRRSPFLSPDHRAPVVAPKILTEAERAQLMAQL